VRGSCGHGRGWPFRLDDAVAFIVWLVLATICFAHFASFHHERTTLATLATSSIDVGGTTI
jgi:Fe2+ transport system protein B